MRRGREEKGRGIRSGSSSSRVFSLSSVYIHTTECRALHTRVKLLHEKERLERVHHGRLPQLPLMRAGRVIAHASSVQHAANPPSEVGTRLARSTAARTTTGSRDAARPVHDSRNTRPRGVSQAGARLIHPIRRQPRVLDSECCADYCYKPYRATNYGIQQGIQRSWDG